MAYERRFNSDTRGKGRDNGRTRGAYRGQGNGRSDRGDDNYRYDDRHDDFKSTRREQLRRDTRYGDQPRRSDYSDNTRRPENISNRNPPSRQYQDHRTDEIRELRSTIVSLQKKLDQMSKPQNVTASSSSNNMDFSDVAKTIYKWAQLKHHRSNWQHVPKSVYNRIDRLVSDIRPPNDDDDLRGLLLSLSTKFANDIRDVVCKHLDAHIADTESHAAELDPRDLPKASNIAARYLKNRLGRLDAGARDALVADAANLIGTKRTQRTARNHYATPSYEIRQTTANGESRRTYGQHNLSPIDLNTDDWHTATGKQATRKRRASDTPVPAITRNPFSPLYAGDDHDDAIEDQQPSDTTKVKAPLKKSKPSNDPKRNVRIFRDDKDRWTFDVAPTTTNIIIGDSNLQKVTRVPPNWQIESLPGAHLRHVTQALTRMTIPADRHINIILQAGINHRDKSVDDFATRLKYLMSELEGNQQVDRIFYAGITASSCLPEADNIKAINQCIIDIVGQENYILPLPPDQIQINSPDKHGIHYDANTADLICEKIYRFVEGNDDF